MLKHIKIICIAILLTSYAFADLKDFKITNWNLNETTPAEYKWHNIVRGLLINEEADILVLQGVKNMPSASKYLNTFTLPYAPKTPIEEYQLYIDFKRFVFVYFVRAESEMRSMNAVIISKKRAQEIIIVQPSKRNFLPLLGIRIDNNVFLNMSLKDPTIPKVINTIQDVYDYFFKYPHIEWALVGDFGIEPTKLQQFLSPEIQEHLSIIAPNVSTRKSGKILDYMISGNSSPAPYLAPPFTSTLAYEAMRVEFEGTYLPIWFKILREQE